MQKWSGLWFEPGIYRETELGSYWKDHTVLMSFYSWKFMQIKIGSEFKIQWPSLSTSKHEHSCSEQVPVFFLISMGNLGLSNHGIHLGWDGVWIRGGAASPVWTFLSISMCEQVFTLQSETSSRIALYVELYQPSSTDYKVQITLWTCLVHRSDPPSLLCGR